jgi:hypothetical protein
MPKHTKAEQRKARISRAKLKIRGLLERGVSGNLRKLSDTTLDIAQRVAPKLSVKKHAVRSGGKKRKTITSGTAKAEIRRRIFQVR